MAKPGRVTEKTGPVSVRLHPRSQADLPVILLRGEFDFVSVPEIDRFLRRHYGPFYFRRHLLFDLGGVTLVDSSFVGFVMGLVRQLRAERRELVLARPVGHVRRSLAAVGLPNVVPVYDSLDEALCVLLSGRLPIIPPFFDPRPLA